MFNEILPKVKNFVIRQTYEGWQVPERKLVDHEFVMVCSDGGYLIADGERTSVKENDLLYYYPGLPHSVHVSGPPYMFFYAVKFSLDKEINRLPLPTVSHIPNATKLRGYFVQLAEIWSKKPYFYEWQQNIIMQQILLEVFTVARQNITPINIARMNKVLEYIHANPYKDYTINELSIIAGIQKSYFISLFKEVTGFTPIRYIINLKLEHSKVMLVNSHSCIKDIANSCGFEDEFYYSKMFKKTFGTSPKKFRYENKPTL